jgi:hypothetical protein
MLGLSDFILCVATTLSPVQLPGRDLPAQVFSWTICAVFPRSIILVDEGRSWPGVLTIRNPTK